MGNNSGIWWHSAGANTWQGKVYHVHNGHLVRNYKQHPVTYTMCCNRRGNWLVRANGKALGIAATRTAAQLLASAHHCRLLAGQQ